jgi:transcriptional regulator with PAS, ATPase and Fis domain
VSHRHLAEEAERAAEARARAAMLEDRVQELVQQAEEREGFHRVVGESPNWKDVLLQATRVATTDTTVLLTGESGTGKEVVARFIHRGSPRANGPLVAVNCAALPEQLLESELFGYERGAFSGALAPKPGRIEQAARGVLFLDEIGEMSMSLQAKLLRVLQEREFQRLGGTRTLKADVRVIAATNRDLIAAMKRGEFREDLFYRLRVFEIRLPALRERRDDILPLTETFLGDLERTLGQRTAGLSREAREILLAYDWPGNIRELRNALERAVILCDGGLITGEQLPLGISDGAPGLSQPAGPDMNVETVERDLIQKALAKAGNNKSKAARLLGLSRAQLYFRLEKYGLAEPPR